MHAPGESKHGETRRGGMAKKMISGFFAILIGYGIIVALLFLFQRNLIYFPSSHRPEPADYTVPEMTVHMLETADNLELLAWYRAPQGPDAPVIVYFHGNAGHIGYRGAKVRPYLDAGYGVLLPSWRGYSGNAGAPSEKGLYADGRAALAFLSEQGIPSARWVLYGESIGSGVAVELARTRAQGEEPVGAVVLESPFTSLEDMAAFHYPWVPMRWLMRDHYNSLSKITAIGAQLLILHGERDRIVPPSFVRRLAEAANEPNKMKVITGAGHNDLYDFGAPGVVLEFLSELYSQPPPR